MTGEYYLGLNKKPVNFYMIKGVAEEILDYLGYGNRYSFVQDEAKLPKEMHPGQSAVISVNNDVVGIIGKVHPKVSKDDVFVLEIDLDKLLDKKVGKMKYKEISKFPNIKKDLAVIVPNNLTSQEVGLKIKKAAGSNLEAYEVFDVYTGAGVEEGMKSLAYSLTFGKMDRTLTDEEINQTLEKIIKDLEKSGITLRK